MALGAVHRVAFRHPLDGRPGTQGLFRTPAQEVADTNHVLNNNCCFAHGARFDVTLWPEFRMLVDPGDLDWTGMAQTTGQSGQPGEPALRRSRAAMWLAGTYDTLPWSQTAVEVAATGDVRLEP